ncbi:NACHT domain-containing NTPase [Streptomyces sp. sk2.1]|uniref:NACHT domain-containing protein n=1 Tax=Streptomyces sp. sk2.1 TaxID=2478959 RepID=UPI0011E68182|nr:ATP-binding protein [Streptomyces sp. sk2.1]TXS59571.1 ATP-binding protein [Streptomyces sp. sk2.1]
MRQLAEDRRADAPDLDDSDACVPGSVNERVSAETVFTGTDRIRVLLAAAGGGKSVLLRHHLSDGAARWLAGRAHDRAHPSVPVLIRATTLAAEPLLVQALEAAVIDELGPYGLREAPTADFFTRPPYSGTPWLVMVDGLDEVSDRATRVALLERLAREGDQEPSTYRFVVATRPLPDGELTRLGPGASRFELQPFTAADLGTYAQRCFRNLPNRDGHVRRFTAGLEMSGLHELARTPLMASMLCPLYAADPARPLPEGRTGAYRSFVELLYEQNTHKSVRATHAEAIRVLTDRHQIPRDQQATEQASRLVRDELPDLIDHVAHERINGNTAPAIAILAAHLHVQRPDKVRPALWNAFLGDLLRPTGLLVERAGDFHFLHQTLLEYHAARHATRDVQARAELLARLFPRRPVPAGDDATPSRVPPSSVQSLAIDPSYLGFLLNGLLTPGDRIATDTVRALDELAAHDAVAAVRLLSHQMRMRTGLPDDFMARHFAAFSRNKELAGYRIVAAWYLAMLAGHRDEGAELLAGLVDDTALPFENRVRAATQLARLKDYRPRAAGFLLRLASDSTLPFEHRLNAGQALGRLAEYRHEVIALFASLLDRAPLPLYGDFYERMDMATVLAGWGDERGTGLLLRMTNNKGLTVRRRARAASGLARLDDERVAGPLAAMTVYDDPEDDIYGPVLAARALTWLSRYREEGARALARIASDPDAWDSLARVEAVEFLADVDGHREEALALLTRLAEAGTARRHAAKALAKRRPTA